MIEIVQNLSLLLSLGLVYHLLTRWWPVANSIRNGLVGLAFGATAIVAMLTAVPVTQGVVVDGRTIMVSLAALFGGGCGGGIAMVMCGLFRISMGGQGIATGLATLLIAGSGGLLARSWFKRHGWPPTSGEIYLFSLLVHLVALSGVLLLPQPVRGDFINITAFPFLVLFPLVTMLLGSIMLDQERWQDKLHDLRHSDWLFDQAQQISRFGCWEYDVGKDRLFGTSEVFRIHGLPTKPRHHTIKDTLRCIDPGYRDKLKDAFFKAIRNHEAFDLEVPMTTLNRDKIWVRVVGQPQISKGRVIRLIGNFFDISDRKNAELALQRSEARLQTILDYAPALICIYDLEGRVVIANQQFQALKTGGLQTGDSIFAGKSEEQAAEDWRDDMALLKAGAIVNFEQVLEHRDGSLHTYLTVKFPLFSESLEGLGVGTISTDITDRKLDENERDTLLARLQEKNQELERFTYVVSHDLRNPLVTILTFLELLVDDHASGNAAAAAEDVKNIRLAAVRMQELLNDLLQLSKLGKAAGTFKPIALNMIVSEVLQLLDGLIRDKKVRVTVAPDLPVVVGDALRLRQVMQNLIENAVKFRRHDVQLEIAIGWERTPSGQIIVSIKDNGVGILAESLEKVFDLFERGQHAGRGHGIGLALVQRIMELHGGMVRAESTGPGCGCIISLLFPVAQESVAGVDDPPPGRILSRPSRRGHKP